MMPGFGRMRRWGGLRYMILYMLRDSPLNGAEIMEKSESVSMGGPPPVQSTLCSTPWWRKASL
jgi:DNA-binding PadR family transcriptional regulator